MVQIDRPYNSEQQLQGLMQTLEDSKRILVLTHGNPDPDALASASALKFLLTSLTSCRVRIGYPGIIGRMENKAMVRELSLKLLPVSEISWKDYDTLILVDHQPRRRMYPWPSGRWPDAIIDHHPRRPFAKPFRFTDIRTVFGSNSSMIASYLFAANLEIPRWLATALAYGILTDTQEFTRGKTEHDKKVYLNLFPSIDHSRLYRISHPVLDCQYLSHYWHALRGARLWDDAVESYIGVIPVPDATSEIADNLIIIRGVRYALVTGYYNRTLYMSLRIRDRRRDAGVMIRRIVGTTGSAGGHGYMAGAQIPGIDTAEDAFAKAAKLHQAFIGLVIRQKNTVKPRPVLSDVATRVHSTLD